MIRIPNTIPTMEQISPPFASPVLQACLDKGITDWGKLKTTTKDVLSDYVWKKTKRRPMILPIIMEV